MKKLNRRLCTLGGLTLVMLCIAASTVTSSAQTLSAGETQKIIAPRARAVILALKTRNMARLSQYVHPTKGLRFSPYYNIRMEKKGDLVFTASQVKKLFATNRRYYFGDYDAGEESIRMTFARYYRKFVYDHDYANAKQIAYGDEFYGRGTLNNNMREAYPNAIFVEYHFPGFEEKFGGMDWRSLWLVFEKKDNDWFLVGIAHGEWTT